MDIIKTIRILSLLELLLITIVLTSGFLLESNLPPLLYEYQQQYSEADPTTTELLALLVGSVTVLLYLASLIGLIFIKLWAGKLFIITTIIMFPLVFFVGPNVDHAISYTFDQLSVLVQGMLLSLLIFTNQYQDAASSRT